MPRQQLDDGTWFDRSSAKHYDEDTWWNGNNHISRATGTQWDHEELFHTAKGRWVLHRHSQWQGAKESWEVVSEEHAKQWLARNGHHGALTEEEDQALEV